MPAVVALRGPARDIKNILEYDRKGNYSVISAAFDRTVEKLGKTRIRELKNDPTKQAETILERLSSKEYNRDHRSFNRTCLRGKFSDLTELATYVSDQLKFPRGHRDLAMLVAVIVACEDSVQYLDVNLGLVAGRTGILKEILFDEHGRVKKFHDPTRIVEEFKKYLKRVVTAKRRQADGPDSQQFSRAVQPRLNALGAAADPLLLTCLVDEDVKKDTLRIRDSLAQGNHLKVVEYLDMWFTLVSPSEHDQKVVFEYLASTGIPAEGTASIAKLRSVLSSIPTVVQGLKEREKNLEEREAVVKKAMSMKIQDSQIKDAVMQHIKDKFVLCDNARDTAENIFESLVENSGMSLAQAMRTMSEDDFKNRFIKEVMTELTNNGTSYLMSDLDCLATAEFAKKYAEMTRDNPASSGDVSKKESSSDSESYSYSE